MADLLTPHPQLSEHDMLVYDHKRASIQHKIANVVILSPTFKNFHITGACRLEAAIYSILATYSFRPPLKIYCDLAKRLQATLVATEGWIFASGATGKTYYCGSCSLAGMPLWGGSGGGSLR